MDVDTKLHDYDPIDGDRAIRLLFLQPGKFNDPLVCNIRNAALDSNPFFECISYKWADVDSGDLNTGDNSKLKINGNLESALCHLRRLDEVRVLWTDQVCIDQKNLKEKEHQVRLMCDIFQTASQVLAWLGLPDENTTGVSEFVQNCARMVYTYYKNESKRGRKVVPNPELLDFLVKEIPTEDDQWTKLREFLGRGWFSRIWIVQEISLAKKIEVHIGHTEMPWNCFQILGTLGRTRPQNDVDPIRDSGEFLKQLAYTRTLLTASPETIEGEAIAHELSLLSLLREFRPRKASNERDKVFALLGMAKDSGAMRLTADYSKPWPQTYTETMATLINYHQDLVPLKLVEIKAAPTPYLPSWSLIFGIYVGEVTAISEPPGNIFGNVAIGAKVLDNGDWMMFARQYAVDSVYPPTKEPIEDAYARLRAGDILGRLTDGPRPSISIDSYRNIGDVSYSNTEGLVRIDRDNIALQILNQTTRRRLFVTDTGYLGLFHRSNKVGDRIYVLMGADMPCVLRAKEERFTFRGESYVHGIMDGEAVAQVMKRSERSEASDYFVQGIDEQLPFDAENLLID